MRILLTSLLCLLGLAAVPPGARAAVSFQHGGYWLTNPTAADLTVQAGADTPADRVQLRLYRLDAPDLLAQVVTARALRSLGEAELLRRVTDTRPVWQGGMILPPADAKTGGAAQPVPVAAMAGPLPGGIYVLTAQAGDAKRGDTKAGRTADTAPDSLTDSTTGKAPVTPAADTARAVQWFVVTDFSLKAQFAGDRAFIAAIDTVQRRSADGVTLRWCDAQGKVVGEQPLPNEGDSTGMQVLARPAGAALLLAVRGETGGAGAGRTGGVGYLAVPDAAKMPPLDGAVIYPGAAAYDPSQAFSFLVASPGETPPPITVNDQPQTAEPKIRGVWSVELPAKASDGALHIKVGQEGELAQLTVPAALRATLDVIWRQRPAALFGGQAASLTFQLKSGGKALADTSGQLTLVAFDATVPATQLPALQLPFTTDAAGVATVALAAGALPPTAAAYHLIVAADGQQSETPAMLAAYPGQSWLEIKPLFADAAVPENVTAQFQVSTHTARGAMAPASVRYQLDREAYSFEWYQAEDGRWTYRTKTVLTPVLKDAARPEKGLTTVAVPVTAGRYRLTVRDEASGLEAVQSFTAGWWLLQPAPETPEKIELTAQVEPKTDQQPERIAVFIDPPFTARVWLTVMNRGGNAPPQTLDVPDEGGFAYVERSAVPPGQPLLLAAYGVPSDPAATLVQAQGVETLPLGGKAEMTVAGKPAEPEIEVTGLPVDQPVDRNIVQALAVIYDADTNEQRGAAQPVTVDTGGRATIRLPRQADEALAAAAPAVSPKLLVRLFVAHQERLDITEQAVTLPKAAPAAKPAKPAKKRK